MTEPSLKKALIVDQVPALTDRGEEALRLLAAEHGIDAYTTRQRLIGGGLSHVGSGPVEQVEAIAEILEAAGLRTWIIAPSRPRFGPQRLRSLELSGDGILLNTQQGAVRVNRSDRVIGVLSDVSGDIVDKQLRRLMVRNVYRGTTDNARLDDRETRRAILLAHPVFDLYLIGSDKQVSAVVRALPGKFDPKGLGERASLSARQNLGALVDLFEQHVVNFSLQTGYGLSKLPGCRLRKAVDGSDWMQDNMKSAVRYGWLMCDLALQPQPHRSASPQTDAPSAGSVAAAALLGRPELATAGDLGEMPGIGEVVEELDRAAAGNDRPQPTEAKPDNGLPLPPEPDRRSFPWRVIAANGTGLIALLVVGAFYGGSSLPSAVFRYGLSAGLLPGLVAVGMFWAGLNFFLLKRHVENTPTSKIRSLAMGMVEIHGRARRKYALVTPMTQTPCIYYRVRKYRRDERKGWQLKSESDSGHVPFYVEDATGRVTVDPHRASIRAGVKQEGSPGQGNILLGGGRSSDSDEKWVEEVIHEGSFLYILGDARLQRRQRASLRDRKIERLRDLKLDPVAMRKYDTDGDGRISETEWQVARDDVEAQVIGERLAEERVAAKQQDYIVIGRSRHRSHPFVIAATRSEAHLTRNYALYSGLLLVASLAAGIWALSLALNYFRII